ncbi:MAG TPA: archaeosortase/exosortase family protein, partial [Elusimicrobiota bacterium]|nr:archaeosortase/exosortase family protein [Elusimicrobiota bacterium]
MPQKPSQRWIWPLTVAAAVFLLLETIDGFIAVPLRELSSVLVQLFLGAFGFPIRRAGTILSTPTMSFDVVPACSGSTTLRVLLFFCIVWAGSHPRLTTARKFAAAALAVPLALLANVVRISMLVVTGHAAGRPAGDFFHSMAGVVAFVLAMIGSYLVTERLAATAAPRPGGGPASLALLAALLAFLFAPFLVWCVPGWAFPLDRLGFLFTVPAAAVGAWWAWRAPADGSCERAGTAAFGAALALLLAATVMDINILKGIAALACLVALALATRGARFARVAAVLAAIAYLGFPTVSYQIQRATVPLLGVGNVGVSLAAKVVIAAGLVALLRLPAFRSASEGGPPSAAGAAPVPRLLPVRLLLVALLAVFHGTWYGFAAGAELRGKFDMSYVLGDWVGRNYPVAEGEEEFFGKGNLWTRRYVHGQKVVDVIVSATGGDRHRAHPPAYCMTGGGWHVVSESTDRRTLGDGS